MADTPRTGMPEISESQATKYVTHNAALRIADALLWGVVISLGDIEPPSGPSDGDTYVLGDTDSTSGDWEGHDYEIAYYQSSAWIFITPEEGCRVWAQDEATVYRYVGASAGWEEAYSLLILSDVADTTYTDQAGKVLRVSDAEDGMELAGDAYDIPIHIDGQPGAGAVVHRQYMARQILCETNFEGSGGKAGTGAGDSGVAVFTLKVDGVEIGTATFAYGDDVPTFDGDSAFDYTIEAGTLLTVEAPNPQDSTLADIALTIAARRTFAGDSWEV